jgi:hypothetical protein
MQVRQWMLLTALAAVLGAGTWFLLSGATRGAEIANVLALPIAIIGLAVAIAGVLPRRDSPDAVSAAARDLARAVRRHELAARAQLLGDVGDPSPADLSYRQPARPRWRTDGGAEQGTLRNVARFYRSLRRGRLVVLGEPGAGKTALAIQLILDLVPVERAGTGALHPVPVRLSLPAFDPAPGADDAHVATMSGPDVAKRFEAWVAENLKSSFAVHPRAARTLVEQGLVLPVLDGLDEMDPTFGPAARAAAVIRGLNHNAASRPFVLTCRSSRFEQLVDVPQDATVVVVDALTPSQASRYIAYRFADPADETTVEARWRPVVRRLTASGTSARPDPLATALCSPLRLYLAVTAYQLDDPADLLVPRSAQETDEHLFRCALAATVRHHPAPGGGRFDGPTVQRWLATLARHLDERQAAGMSPRDLSLHLIWPAAGRRMPRFAGAALLTAAGLVALVLGVWAPFFAVTSSPNLAEWLACGFGVALLAKIALRASQTRVQLRRTSFGQLRTRNGRRSLFRGVAYGLAIGIGYGLGYGGLAGTPLNGLIYAISTGPLIGLAIGLAHQPTTASTPRSLVRQGLSHDLVVGIAGSIAIGGAVALSFGPAHGLLIMSTYGLILGLVGGMAATQSPWPRYLVATTILARRGDLPFRLARFIDWALSAGLLRMAGSAVQFRHRELRTWLSSDGRTTKR